MGKHKIKILRPKPLDELTANESSTFQQGSMVEYYSNNMLETSNPEFTFSDAILSNKPVLFTEGQKTNSAEQVPALADDPGIVAMLNNPMVGEYIEKLKGLGTELSEDLLSSLGFRNIENVKVHTDQIATLLCELLNARAFAYGKDIFFNEGEFDVASNEGKELLKHELGHVEMQLSKGYEIMQRQVTLTKSDIKNIEPSLLSTKQLYELYYLIQNCPAETEKEFYSKYPYLKSFLEKLISTNFEYRPQRYSVNETARWIRQGISGEQSNLKPELAIELHQFIKNNLVEPEERAAFYERYPDLVELIDDNLPVEYLRSSASGFDKGYLMSDEDLQKEIDKYSQTNPELKRWLEKIKQEDDLNTIKSYTNNKDGGAITKAFIDDLWYSEQRFDKRVVVILKAMAWALKKKETRKSRGVNTHNLGFERTQKSMGGHISGIEISDSMNDMDNNNVSLLTNRKDNHTLIHISKLPIDRINFLGDTYAIRTGTDFLSNLDVSYNWMPKEKETDKAKGTIIIQGDAVLTDFRFTSGASTYGATNVNIKGLYFEVTKDFADLEKNTNLLEDLDEGGKGLKKIMMKLIESKVKDSNITFLLELLSGQLPTVFGYLTGALMQLVQHIVPGDEKEREGNNQDFLRQLSSDQSDNYRLVFHYDNIFLENFAMLGDKLSTAKYIKTGAADWNMSMKSSEVDLQQLRDEKETLTKLKEYYIELYKKLSFASSKEEMVLLQSAIDTQKTKIKAQEEVVFSIEKSQGFSSSFDVKEIEIQDDNFVGGIISSLAQEYNVSSKNEFNSNLFRFDYLKMNSTFTGKGEGNTTLETKIPKIELEGPITYMGDGITVEIGKKLSLENLNVGVKFIYKEAEGDQDRIKMIDHIYVWQDVEDKAIIDGGLCITTSKTDIRYPDTKQLIAKGFRFETIVSENKTQIGLSQADLSGLDAMGLVTFFSKGKFNVKDLNIELVGDGPARQSEISVKGVKIDELEVHTLNILENGNYIATPLGKPVLLKDINSDFKISEGPHMKDETVDGSVKRYEVTSMKVGEVKSQGLSLKLGEFRAYMDDSKESILKNLRVMNFAFQSTTIGDKIENEVQGLNDKNAQIKIESSQFSSASIKYAKNLRANLQKLNSGAIDVEFLSNGGVKYDVKQLKAGGTVHNVEGGGRQDINAYINSKSISGSYINEIINKDGQVVEEDDSNKNSVRKKHILTNEVNIPRIDFPSLKMISPDLVIDIPGTGFYKSYMTDLTGKVTVTIIEPSIDQENEAKKLYEQEAARIKANVKLDAKKRQAELKKAKEKTKARDQITIHVDHLDMKKLVAAELSFHSSSATKVEQMDDNFQKFYKVVNDLKLRKDEVAEMNDLHIENFTLFLPDEEGEKLRAKGLLELGRKETNGSTSIGLAIGSFDMVNEMIKNKIAKGNKIANTGQGSKLEATASFSAEKIFFKGDTAKNYSISIQKPEISGVNAMKGVENDTERKRVRYRSNNNDAIVKKGISEMENAQADFTVALDSPTVDIFNLFSADKIEQEHTLVEGEEENIINDKVTFTNPNFPHLKILGEYFSETTTPKDNKEQEFDYKKILASLEYLVLAGKIDGDIIVERKRKIDKATSKIKEEEVVIYTTGDILKVESGKLKINQEKVLTNTSEQKEKEENRNVLNNNLNLLNYLEGNITVSLFGEPPFTLPVEYVNNNGKYEGGFVNLNNLIRQVSVSLGERAHQEGNDRAAQIFTTLEADVNDNQYILEAFFFKDTPVVLLRNISNNLIYNESSGTMIRLSALADSLIILFEELARAESGTGDFIGYTEQTMMKLSDWIHRQNNAMNPQIVFHGKMDFYSKQPRELMKLGGLIFNSEKIADIDLTVNFDQTFEVAERILIPSVNTQMDGGPAVMRSMDIMRRKMTPIININNLALPGFKSNNLSSSKGKTSTIEGSKIEIGNVNILMEDTKTITLSNITLKGFKYSMKK